MSSNCPICNGEINPFDNHCLTCGWDLTELPEAFHIPETFESKLLSAIESARKGWNQAQVQAIEIQQLQEENAKLSSDLRWYQFASSAEQRWQELDQGESQNDTTSENAEAFNLDWTTEGVA